MDSCSLTKHRCPVPLGHLWCTKPSEMFSWWWHTGHRSYWKPMLFWNGRWQMGRNALHLREHCTSTFTQLNPVSLLQLQCPSSVILPTCLAAPWQLLDAPCLSTLNYFLKDGVAYLFFQGFPLQLSFQRSIKLNLNKQVQHTCPFYSPEIHLHRWNCPFTFFSQCKPHCYQQCQPVWWKVGAISLAVHLGRPVCRLCNTHQAKVMLSGLHVQPAVVQLFSYPVFVKVTLKHTQLKHSWDLGEMSTRLNCKCVTQNSGENDENQSHTSTLSAPNLPSLEREHCQRPVCSRWLKHYES